MRQISWGTAFAIMVVASLAGCVAISGKFETVPIELEDVVPLIPLLADREVHLPVLDEDIDDFKRELEAIVPSSDVRNLIF